MAPLLKMSPWLPSGLNKIQLLLTTCTSAAGAGPAHQSHLVPPSLSATLVFFGIVASLFQPRSLCTCCSLARLELSSPGLRWNGRWAAALLPYRRVPYPITL